LEFVKWVFYDYAISDTVKSTLNNWFSDTPEQKQQKFNIIIDGSSSEFKQALEAESGKMLEQIKQPSIMMLNFCCFCSGVSLNQLLRVDLTVSLIA
jgi:hypothetical protein